VALSQVWSAILTACPLLQTVPWARAESESTADATRARQASSALKYLISAPLAASGCVKNKNAMLGMAFLRLPRQSASEQVTAMRFRRLHRQASPGASMHPRSCL